MKIPCASGCGQPPRPADPAPCLPCLQPLAWLSRPRAPFLMAPAHARAIPAQAGWPPASAGQALPNLQFTAAFASRCLSRCCLAPPPTPAADIPPMRTFFFSKFLLRILRMECKKCRRLTQGSRCQQPSPPMTTKGRASRCA